MQVFSFEEEENLPIPKADFSETDAITLNRVHGKKIKIEWPNPLNNYCYILRSRGYVGQIPLSDDVSLSIFPKVPLSNLFRMLEYAYNLESFQFLEGKSKAESLEDIFENLALVLAKRILDRVRKGLYHDYLDKVHSMQYLRGRIHIVPSLLALMRGSLNVVCNYEDYTADLKDNQIITWTLYVLPKFHFQREEVRRSVRQAYHVLSRVAKLRLIHPNECKNRFYHRLNEDYRPMHGLCRFFLEHSGPALETGKHEFIPFVLNMPDLFQSFIAEWLHAHLSEEYHVSKQYHAKLDTAGNFYFLIDLVLTDSTTKRTLAVLDTKYKRAAAPVESDIQQVVAYAVRMDTENAFLIYPSTHTQSDRMDVGKIRVQSLSFDISEDPDEAGHTFIENLLSRIS
jgi:5-methylcytosine-specific restriction enzyme subunit McrC